MDEQALESLMAAILASRTNMSEHAAASEAHKLREAVKAQFAGRNAAAIHAQQKPGSET